MEHGFKKSSYKWQWLVNNEAEIEINIIQPAPSSLSSFSSGSSNQSNVNNYFYKASRTNSIVSSISDASSWSFSLLDNYTYHELKPEQIETFEQLLLNVTVACGFSFRWIDNPAAKELFKWLNPMLELLDQKQLSGRILQKSSDTLQKLFLMMLLMMNLGLC